MSPAERTRAGFTAADQKAINDGADINQVVNAHRGMYTTVVGGRKIKATREGTTVRGVFGGFQIDPDTGQFTRRAAADLERRKSGSRRIGAAKAPRLTPEQIYRIAGDNRDEAVRLLRRNGYLLGRTPAPKPVDPLEAYRRRAAAARTGDAALDAAPINTTRHLPFRGPGSLTDAEQNALRNYKGTGYDNINGALRRERGNLPGGFGFQFYREATSALDSALGKSVLAADVLVERGIREGAGVFGEAWNRSLVGAEWTEHAYLSTSTDPAIARRFTSPTKPDGAVVRILAPQGTKGITLSGSEYESEILLERGLRLRVVSDTGPGPNRVIEVEVVPGDATRRPGRGRTTSAR